jgi:small conductance mechanosensitive channel
MNVIIKPLLIILIAFVSNLFVGKFVSLLVEGLKKQSTLSAHLQRIDTLKSFFKNISAIIIYSIAFLMILSEFNFSIMPILTGAGIAGIAISFGAQSLVKDFISGFFIILENQYNVGDEIKVGDFQGKVVKVTFRTTVLRDKHENIIHILNSEIKNIIVIKK